MIPTKTKLETILYSIIEELSKDNSPILNNEVEYRDIKEVLDYEQKDLGDFKIMLDNKDMLKDAYDKLKGINNKPNFDDVWNTIINYLEKEKLINSKNNNRKKNKK